MKIYKVLIEIILPIVIGTLIFLGYFFIDEKLSAQTELESCERYELSKTVWFLFFLILVIFSSLYQLFIGNQFLKRNGNKFVLNIFSCIIFALVFTGIFVADQIIENQEIEIKFLAGFFLAILVLGLLFFVLRQLTGKILRNKFVD